MPRKSASNDININMDVAKITNTILKAGKISKKALCEEMGGMNIKTLERRLEILKSDKRFYLFCLHGQDLQLREIFNPLAKKAGGKKRNNKEANPVYNVIFQKLVKFLDDAIRKKKWVQLLSYGALTKDGTKTRRVFPLELIYTETDVKLLAVSEKHPTQIKMYLVSRMNDIINYNTTQKTPTTTTKQVKFDDFGMIYANNNEVMKFTLYMTAYASDMLAHDFTEFKPFIKKTPKKDLIVKTMFNKTFKYDSMIELKSCFPAPIARFTIGMLDSFIIKCDQQAGIDYIRNYMRDTIIPCLDTQFIDLN
jgi:hypothetical protein